MHPILGDETSGRSSCASEPADQIIARAQKGDCVAFAELFELFNRPICTYLTRMVGNDELARDLAQETFLKAWKNLPRLHGELHFRAWLYRIATNVAYSHQRRARLIRWLPWSKDDEEAGHVELSVAGPEESVGEAELVQQALACLTPQYKACLLLQIVEGFSQREVAEMLGISEKSVGANVCRGREQFRQLYRQLKGAAE